MERPASDAPPALPPLAMWIPAVPEAVEPLDVRRMGSSRGSIAAWMLFVIAIVEAAALSITLPRSRALDGLVAENLGLREKLGALEAKIVTAEALFARIRQYDSRIRSLFGPVGDHGGPELPEALTGDASGAAVGEDHDETDMGIVRDFPVSASDGGIDPEQLRPAGVWADGLILRLDELSERYAQGQPDLERLLVELEGLKGVVDALPGRWPSDGEITSSFGWRTDPVHGGTRFHAGLDLADDRGTPIYAVAAGRVIRAETSGGYGRMVEIDHGYGITTRYAHCTTLRVKAGDRVERGAFISTMGSTGKSTGSHLHFELRIDDSPHDPLKYLPR
jgi:murein DD-endopeptidase MepM/ murein hydrolase activator NlpD